MTTDFDSEAFMQSVVETGETKFPLTPIGEYVGTITELKPATGTSKDGNPWAQIRIAVETSDPAALVGTNLPKRTVRGSIMLDLDENGTPSPIKTIKWNRLAEAAGFPKGSAYSPYQLVGRTVRFTVSHRIDRNDPEKMYDDLKDFRAA